MPTAPQLRPTPRAAISALLAIPLVLWVFATLYFLRITPAINLIVKRMGPALFYGCLTLSPLAALILGIRLVRQKRALPLATTAIMLGAGMLAAFTAVIAVPLARKKGDARTAKLPSHPTPLPPMTGLAVFPGAEGFGTRTPAGRGGRVIEVTSLADSGPGSLRAALDAPGPRTIVFRVSGTIVLDRPLIVTKPFFTLAGQTAPGGGICLMGASLVITTHDALVQHIRVRPGNEGKAEPDDNDAISLLGPRGHSEGASHVVLDHVSASWAEDETISTWFGAHDITISWCIVSEGLNHSRHHKGAHSTGLLIGDNSDHVSVHHCLLAHNSFRNPLISRGGTHDIVNNVVYDWRDIPGEVFDEDSNTFVNWTANTFRPGPSAAEPGMFEIIVNSSGVPKLHPRGNRGPHRAGDSQDEWSLVSFKWDQKIAPEKFRAAQRFETWPITTASAEDAFAAVLADAGAILPARDPADARVVGEVKAGTGRVIDSPAQAGGYPALASGEAPPDSDHDGIPDAWETAHALDPHDAADAAHDSGDGYTHLEKYLHALSRK